MREYIELGPCPCNEEAVDVCAPGGREANQRECECFVQAIRNYLGREPEGARLGIKRFEHEMRAYREVVCYYDPENEIAAEYAWKCERQSPLTWSDGGVKSPERELARGRGR